MTDILKAAAIIRELNNGLCGTDFLLTWDKTDDDLKIILQIAALLKELHRDNISCRVFESGLAVSLFRDQSTRTRFSFASAANLLGLAVQDLDEGKSQIAHGETVRETAAMISFLTEVIGIRDDIFLGAGHKYMVEVGNALEESFQSGVLHQRPAVLNLQCDVDHPTQSLADLLHLEHHFGSLANLKGKKIAMSWAYSPSYGKPLSVPQGIIGLMSRFGTDLVLAHPEGYDLIPEVVDRAAKQAGASGGSFRIVNSMEEAFEGADIVYPKSWAPYRVMERRTELLQQGDQGSLADLEKECLATNARFAHWECTEPRMKLTRNGQALYMHCLPADISGVSCARGEVQDTVFERYRTETYKQAGYKPFVIAAMIVAARRVQPASILEDIARRRERHMRG
jgi:knotted carbamoyltransferase YgeW